MVVEVVYDGTQFLILSQYPPAAVPYFAGLNLSSLTGNRIVLTDASKNLISAALSTWTPTPDAEAPLTLSSVTVLLNHYVEMGPLMFCSLQFTGTLGGTAAPVLKFNLPDGTKNIASGNYQGAAGSVYIDSIGNIEAISLSLDPNSLTAKIRRYDQANWPNTSYVKVGLNFFYLQESPA
jgi:hypothetical protein